MKTTLKMFICLTALALSLAISVPAIAQQWGEHEGYYEFQRIKAEMAQLHERIEADKERLEADSVQLRTDQKQMEELRHRMEEMRERSGEERREHSWEEHHERREEGR